MLVILAFLFLARRYGSDAAPIAAPFDEAYKLPIITQDERFDDCFCPGRTVWDIVWSCLATTFAVTWVSVHPNAPWFEEKSSSLLKRRIFLMCLALLAPEVMIMWAFKQWRGALMIRETINKSRPNPCVQWTMAHAHFLQMGGFKVNYIESEFDVESEYRNESEKEGIVVQESVIHLIGLRELLENQLIDFPHTTPEEIEDKSKRDGLSKGVALLQITWFIIQLIARAHQNLTITEIELTTAALAGLNSIMYIFWWNKPLAVKCPIVIKTKQLESLLAGRAGKLNEEENRSRTSERRTFSKDEFRLRDYLRDSPAWVALDLAAKTLCPVWVHTICRRFASFAQATISALAPHLQPFSKWLLKTIGMVDASEVHVSEDDEFVIVDPGIDLTFPVTRSPARRVVKSIWTTCKHVVTNLFYLPHLFMVLPMDQILQPCITSKFSCGPFHDAKDKMHRKPALELLFEEADMEWIMSMMFFSERAETRPLLYFSALAGAAFGSIHCAAWNFHFPSSVEQILWRTASLTIIGLCHFIIAISPFYTRLVYDRWDSCEEGTLEDIYWTRIKKTAETLPAIIYPVCRLSLLVLALLSLRRLPPSAFDTVDWTKFIPHI